MFSALHMYSPIFTQLLAHLLSFFRVSLPKIYTSLAHNGLFCVEVRTTNDPLYGVGKDCGDNTFLTDHRRRFIESNVFLKQVLLLGFSILFFTEENNLSIYKDDNPVLLRIILKKI